MSYSASFSRTLTARAPWWVVALTGLGLVACSSNTCPPLLELAENEPASMNERMSGGIGFGSAADLASGSYSAPTEMIPVVSIDLPIDLEEADLVKLDGDRLFVHNSDEGLYLIDVADPAKMSVLALASEIQGEAGELYVRGDSAFVLVGEVGQECELPQGSPWSGTQQRFRLASVSFDGEPSVASEQCFPGHVVGSRRIDDKLYIVSAQKTEFSEHSWVTSIDIADAAQPSVVSQHALADVGIEEIHATDHSLYAIATEEAASGSTVPEATRIHYFDVEASSGKLALGDEMVVSGAAQGRFHLDEHGEDFRLVTYSETLQHTFLHVVDVSNPEELTLEGTLADIAPGEHLHATRFVGDRAYVVTFKVVMDVTTVERVIQFAGDPLFVISLEDPSNPTILGELEIPGFSTFLYPRGDTLLAVGRGDNGRQVAASLFDIADPKNPSELQRLEFGADESFSEGNLDYRGMTLIEEPVDGGSPLLAIPLTTQTGSTPGECRQSNALVLIDVEEDALVMRNRRALPKRVQRLLAKDEHLLSVGRQYVGAVSYEDRAVPSIDDDMILGDAEAAPQCIDFEEVLGNSSESLANSTAPGDVQWVPTERTETVWVRPEWEPTSSWVRDCQMDN